MVISVCTCVWKRETEKERERERGRETGSWQPSNKASIFPDKHPCCCRVGRPTATTVQDIQLSGAHIRDEHCIFDTRDGVVTMVPCDGALCYFNGASRGSMTTTNLEGKPALFARKGPVMKSEQEHCCSVLVLNRFVDLLLWLINASELSDWSTRLSSLILVDICRKTSGGGDSTPDGISRHLRQESRVPLQPPGAGAGAGGEEDPDHARRDPQQCVSFSRLSPPRAV